MYLPLNLTISLTAEIFQVFRPDLTGIPVVGRVGDLGTGREGGRPRDW